jgi:hypothetical protein
VCIDDEKRNMTQNQNITTEKKRRLTAFIDPILLKRAKVRGALEGLTISEVVEKALDSFVPKIEKDANQRIHLKFSNDSTIDSLIPQTGLEVKRTAIKHAKNLVIPR